MRRSSSARLTSAATRLRARSGRTTFRRSTPLSSSSTPMTASAFRRPKRSSTYARRRPCGCCGALASCSRGALAEEIHTHADGIHAHTRRSETHAEGRRHATDATDVSLLLAALPNPPGRFSLSVSLTHTLSHTHPSPSTPLSSLLRSSGPALQRGPLGGALPHPGQQNRPGARGVGR